jgi:hypothetical protein
MPNAAAAAADRRASAKSHHDVRSSQDNDEPISAYSSMHGHSIAIVEITITYGYYQLSRAAAADHQMGQGGGIPHDQQAAPQKGIMQMASPI